MAKQDSRVKTNSIMHKMLYDQNVSFKRDSFAFTTGTYSQLSKTDHQFHCEWRLVYNLC